MLRIVVAAGAALLLLAGVIACSPFAPLNLVASGAAEKVATAAYGVGERRRLDIYRPAGAAGPLKTVVFFYGGSWKGGARGDYGFAAEALASRGWLVVVPDYRVYPEVRFPGFVEDAAAAVAWVAGNVGRYGGDPDRLYLVGHSAGGHIALMLTLAEEFLAAEGLSNRIIDGTVALAAPAAFDPLKYASVRPLFERMADPSRARPIEYVDGGEPPLLLLHGLDDGTVFPSNSQALAARIREAGGAVRHVTYPGVGHIGIVLALAAPVRALQGEAVLDDIAGFIDAH